MKRRKRVFLSIVLGCAAFLFLSSESFANIVIKVRALNPLESDETASIFYPLPSEVTPADIIEKKISFSRGVRPDAPTGEEGQETKTTFNIEYMPEEGRYYIVDEVPLGPREVVTLEVHVRDIWSIARETLDSKRKAVEDLIASFHPVQEGSEEGPEEGEEPQEGEETEDETIDELKEQIFMELEEIAARQAKNTVLKVGVEQHMEAYYENLEALNQLDADVEMLRYLLEPEEEEVEGEEVEGEETVPEDIPALEEEKEEASDLELPLEEVSVPDVLLQDTSIEAGPEGSEK